MFLYLLQAVGIAGFCGVLGTAIRLTVRELISN